MRILIFYILLLLSINTYSQEYVVLPNDEISIEVSKETTMEYKSQKVGFFRGTFSFIGSIFSFCGDGIGELAYSASEVVNDCNIAPERTFTRTRESKRILIRETQSIKILTPKEFYDIIYDELSYIYFNDFIELELIKYKYTENVFFAEVKASFKEFNGGKQYEARVDCESKSSEKLAYDLVEKVKAMHNWDFSNQKKSSEIIFVRR